MLDELTSKVNTLNLERVRRLKSKLVILTSRVQKVTYLRLTSSGQKDFVFFSSIVDATPIG